MAQDCFSFTVRLAGVPVGIRCRHEENRDFLWDYLTNEAPRLICAPTPQDEARTRAGLVRMGMSPPGRLVENNAIHALVAEGLLDFDVLLMHGSALCMDGEAYIFTAASGTGKSTHARLWREVFGDRVWMINDDKPLLRFEGGRVNVYGTPWDGKHRLSRDACAPLKAVVSLCRSGENRISPLSRADAFGVIRQRAYTSPDAEKARKCLALDRALLDAVPFYRLACNMEPSAALTAWRGMNPDPPHAAQTDDSRRNPRWVDHNHN